MYPFLLAAGLFSTAIAAPEASSESPAPKAKKLQHEIGFRARAMGAPKGILDIWYDDLEEWEESNQPGLPDEPRPNPRGYSLGVEYVLKSEKSNGIFYFDYFDSTMKSGYFDDKDSSDNHFDGSVIEPTKNLGFIAIGADFAYDIQLVRPELTKGIFALSLLPGAGLGISIITGRIDEWKGSPTTAGLNGLELYETNADPNDKVDIPPVLPIVDINLSLRMVFARRISLRLEGGLHNFFYYGASVGVTF